MGQGLRNLRAATAALGFAALLAGASPGSAQEVSAEQRARLDAAFQELLENPTDLDKTYAYAKMAEAAGDYEGAITSYERLLLFNPDLPRVKTELGVGKDGAAGFLAQKQTSPSSPCRPRRGDG